MSLLKERKTIGYASVTKFSEPIHNEIHDHQQRDSAFGSLELNMLPKYYAWRIQTTDVVVMAIIVPLGIDCCASFKSPDLLDPAMIPLKQPWGKLETGSLYITPYFS